MHPPVAQQRNRRESSPGWQGVPRGTVDLAPRVVRTADDTATVRDCYGDDTGVYDGTTGAREDKPTGQRHLVTATLHLDGVTWKVERLKNEGLGCTAA